jgi:hypothetical protein
MQPRLLRILAPREIVALPGPRGMDDFWSADDRVSHRSVSASCRCHGGENPVSGVVLWIFCRARPLCTQYILLGVGWGRVGRTDLGLIPPLEDCRKLMFG